MRLSIKSLITSSIFLFVYSAYAQHYPRYNCDTIYRTFDGVGKPQVTLSKKITVAMDDFGEGVGTIDLGQDVVDRISVFKVADSFYLGSYISERQAGKPARISCASLSKADSKQTLMCDAEYRTALGEGVEMRTSCEPQP